MRYALKITALCLLLSPFCFAREAQSDTLFVADNDFLNPVVGKLNASFGIEGAFSVPAPITGMATGPGGQIFVDTATRLYEYTSSGAAVRTFGGGGIDAFGDLAFDGTTLFVADNDFLNPVVGKLDASFGIEGSFSVPAPITGMAAGPGGQIFVDTATRLYEYTSSGAVVRTFGGGGIDALGDLAFDGPRCSWPTTLPAIPSWASSTRALASRVRSAFRLRSRVWPPVLAVRSLSTPRRRSTSMQAAARW